MLYDLKNDPQEDHPIADEEVVGRMRRQMVRLMMENDAPEEQYERMGLLKERAECR